MNVAISRIGKIIRTLGLMGIMMALAGLMVNAPAASAASSKLKVTPAVGKLNVYVGFPASANTLPTVQVGVIDSNGNYVAKGTTDSNNSYTTSLASGAYKVLVSAEGYKPSTSEAEIVSGQETNVKVALVANDPVSGPAGGAVIVPEEDGKLLVNISDAKTGKPVAGATVVIYNAKGDGVTKGSADSEGNFATVLAPGTYKLYTTADGYADTSQTIEISSGQMAEAKVALSSTSSDTDPYIGPVIIW
jgi:5-hydroxyisourate hydrolase-like protein (transthyretin family)